MQFTKPFKEAIAAGDVTVSFRRWRSPQARVGGRYNIAPFGAIEVTGLEQIAACDIRAKDAKLSGFADAAAIRAYLKVSLHDTIYRVGLRFLGAALVNQPVRDALSEQDLTAILQKLTAIDQRTGGAPWTRATLLLIANHPGVRAGDLAPQLGLELQVFKTRVRRLKAMGLTISLETGYQLSERGRQVHAALKSDRLSGSYSGSHSATKGERKRQQKS